MSRQTRHGSASLIYNRGGLSFQSSLRKNSSIVADCPAFSADSSSHCLKSVASRTRIPESSRAVNARSARSRRKSCMSLIRSAPGKTQPKMSGTKGETLPLSKAVILVPCRRYRLERSTRCTIDEGGTDNVAAKSKSVLRDGLFWPRSNRPM